ncbi:ATP-binding protein [bacterium]|nr:ATP-binding protein [bacterium]
MGPDRSLKVELNADPCMLVVVCSAVRQFAEACGMDERNSQRLELATDEICSNIICHAYGQDPSETFRLEADVEDEILEIRIYDHGKGFELEDVKKPDITCPLNERQIGGLGIFLVRKVVDSLSYGSVESGENCFRFTKRIETLPHAAEA